MIDGRRRNDGGPVWTQPAETRTIANSLLGETLSTMMLQTAVPMIRLKLIISHRIHNAFLAPETRDPFEPENRKTGTIS